MSLTSYRAAPPRVGICIIVARADRGGFIPGSGSVDKVWVGRPGGDLLSRALRHSTMGAGGFHGRVREGIGCGPPAKATRSSSPYTIAGFQAALFLSSVFSHRLSNMVARQLDG